MHNGGIGCWRHIKRNLALSLGERWFGYVQGSTDSEWAFALFLDCLEKAGYDPDSPPSSEKGFGHSVLRKAILKTISRINAFIAALSDKDRADDCRSLLNFAITDGHSVVCSRYVSSRKDEAASLFFSSGTSWKEKQAGKKGGSEPVDPNHKDYVMERRDKGSDIVLVASEPLTFERGEYLHYLLLNHMLIVVKTTGSRCLPTLLLLSRTKPS